MTLRRAALGLLLCGLCLPAAAARFLVSPTLVDAAPDARATVLQIVNQDSRAVSVQTRVFRWSQQGDEETLEPTEAVVTSPPIARIEAGRKQLVRIVRLAADAPASEESYRVLVDELPDATKSGQSSRSRLDMLLRYSVPVFFRAPAPAVTGELHWGASRQAHGLILRARNQRASRVRLSGLGLTLRGERIEPYGAGLLGYVLAGNTRSFRVPLPASWHAARNESIALDVQTENGEIRVRVPLVNAP